MPKVMRLAPFSRCFCCCCRCSSSRWSAYAKLYSFVTAGKEVAGCSFNYALAVSSSSSSSSSWAVPSQSSSSSSSSSGDLLQQGHQLALLLTACYLLHAAKDETRRQHFDAAKIKAADCLHNSGLWNGTIECQDQRHRPVYPVSALKRNECPCPSPSARDLFFWPQKHKKKILSCESL